MGYIDMHSHILPGLDDGSRGMEQSVNMLRIAVREEIATIIATPHNMPGKGCPSRDVVEQRCEELQNYAESAHLPINIQIGTEYFYREEVLELFEQGGAITLADTDRILIEFDPGAERRYIRNAIREVLSVGYVPVIAHVERYMHLMEKHFETIAEMRKMGALIQVNSGSVTGDNGFKTKQAAHALLKKQLVDFIGSDAHSDGRRSPKMKDCVEYLRRKADAEYAEYLLGAKALYERR